MTLVATFLLAFLVFIAAIASMAIGVLQGRRPISGSCGGLNGGRCELCSGLRRESCIGEPKQ